MTSRWPSTRSRRWSRCWCTRWCTCGNGGTDPGSSGSWTSSFPTGGSAGRRSAKGRRVASRETRPVELSSEGSWLRACRRRGSAPGRDPFPL
jgi:hypothetical protein